MRRVLLLLLVFFSLVPSAYGVVTELTVDPGSPTVGDDVDIQITADTFEAVQVTITFSHTVSVSGGEYEYWLRDVDIPTSTNSFTVKGTNIDYISVSTTMSGVSITKTSPLTDNGVASISHSDLPSNDYDIYIAGRAADGATLVELDITAKATLVMDSEGVYTYVYDTSPIPAGVFTVKAGGITRSITLSSSSPPSSGGGIIPVGSAPVPVITGPSTGYIGEPVTLDGGGLLL